MSLATFQQSFKQLLMSPEGVEAIHSQEQFEAFVDALPITPSEKAALRQQSLARLEQYQFMLWANVDETLSSIFPFIYQLLGDGKDAVVRAYFYACPNASYKLMAVGEVFPLFISQQAQWLKQYPFLAELAQYEWVEAELLSAPNPVFSDSFSQIIPTTSAMLAQYSPVLNDVSRLLQFTYPVPAIVEALKAGAESEALLQFAQKPTFVFAYRNTGPYHCRFFELNPLLATWIALVQSSDESASYQETADSLLEQLRHQNPALEADYFYGEFLKMLQQLSENRILLGSTPSLS